MARQEITNPMDDNNLNKQNHNFKELYKGVSDAGKRIDGIVDEVSDAAFDKVVDNAKINWKEPVNNFNNLPSNAQEGDTRMDRSTGKVYRYDGDKWVEIQQIDAGPVNELDSRLTSQLNDTVALSDISEEGRKIKIVTGILRNTGEGWDFITDATHNRINSTVVESDDSGITLNYGFTAKKILSFVATPDETLAHAGFFVGASVGTTKAIIEMSKKPKNCFAILRNPNTSDVIDISNGVNVLSTEWDSSNNRLVVYTIDTGNYIADVSSRKQNIDARIISAAPSRVFIQFFSRNIVCGYISYNSTTGIFDITPTGMSGITGAVWDNNLKALKVSHVDINVYSGSVTTKSTPYTANFESQSPNVTYIAFYDAQGTKLTNPQSGMSVFFQRQSDTTKPIIPAKEDIDILFNRTTEVKKCNPLETVSANGNIWCMGVFEV